MQIGKQKFHLYCENCEFETESMTDDEFEIYRMTELPKMEGAFVADGEGGCITICPKCKQDAMRLES